MKYNAHCKQCRNRSKSKRKIVDKIDIPQAHHRSLPWIGTYTSTKRGVVELESWAQHIHLLMN